MLFFIYNNNKQEFRKNKSKGVSSLSVFVKSKVLKVYFSNVFTIHASAVNSRLQKTFVISSFMFSCSMTSNLRCSFKTFVKLQALRKNSDSDFCSRNCLLLYFFLLAYLVCPFSLTLMNFFHCRSVFPVRIMCSSSGVHDKVTEEGYVGKSIDLCILELDPISMLYLSFVHFQLF